jgi:hypothetical protein
VTLQSVNGISTPKASSETLYVTIELSVISVILFPLSPHPQNITLGQFTLPGVVSVPIHHDFDENEPGTYIPVCTKDRPGRIGLRIIQARGYGYRWATLPFSSAPKTLYPD